jgi:hypothetical protein
VCPYHSRPPLWSIGFSSNVHYLSYTDYIMCKLSFIHLVNDNSSILSLMILFSSIFFVTVYVNSLLYLLCVGSTHLHGIIADRLLGKRHTKLFLQVPKIEDNEKHRIFKRIHSYTLQFLCMEGKYDNASSNQRIVLVNHEHRDKTNIIHRKIQVSKLNG